MDLAIGITVGASTQVALLVAPILVFAGYFLGQDMNLLFTRYEMWAVVLAVFITRLLIYDGESTWLEGLMLIAIYVMLGIGFFHLSPDAGQRVLNPIRRLIDVAIRLSLRPPPGDRRRRRATRRRACRRSDARPRRPGIGGLWAGGGPDALDSAGCSRHFVHRADQHADHHAAAGRLFLVPADHLGLSAWRRIVHGRQGEPGHHGGPVCRGGALARLRARGGRRHLGGCRGPGLGAPGAPALHAVVVPSHPGDDHAGQSSRRA